MRTRLLSAALAAALSSCAQDVPDITPSTGVQASALTPAPTLARDADAISRLSSSRQADWSRLEGESAVKPEVTLDLASGALLTISLDWKGPTGKPGADALTFIDTYQAMIDPRISAGEYVRQTERVPCGSTITFDRTIGGLQVIGSRLTLHFNGEGHLSWVTNGVAPVKATIVKPDPWKIPGALWLKSMLGKAPLQGAPRVRVLAPMHDGSGLFEAELVAWFDDGRQRGALAIGDVAVSSRFDGQDEGTGRSTTGPSSLAGSNTDVPSLVKYGAMGNAAVAGLIAERNPLESAYRFLEEHPTLYRTGAARCQYVPTRFDENPTQPGVFTVRLAQQHGPLPVFGAELVVRVEGVDRVSSIVARARGNIVVNPTPAVSVTTAITSARATLTGAVPSDWKQAVDEALASAPRTELVVFPLFLDRDPQQRRDHLAWKVELGSFTLIFDAHTGQRLFESSKRHAARIINDAEGDGVAGLLLGYHLVAVNGATVSTSPTPTTDIFPGLDGITGGLPRAVEDYNALLLRNGHVGMDGRGGGDFIANTNVNIEFGGCPNAFFDSYLTWQAYLCPGVASADVTGHELTHGVIAKTTGLAMSDQSGAINEAYSDILGDLADRTRNRREGETTTTGRFRDLLNPGLSNPSQPGHFSGFVPRTTAACAGSVFPWDCDFGNVHTNSGIINRAHMLMELGDGSFAGIGTERMEQLAFNVATTSLPAFATMHQVAGATRDVCERFVARGVITPRSGLSYTSAHCDSVNSAFRSVGLDPSLTSGWSEPRLGFSGTDTIDAPGADGRPPLTPSRCAIRNAFLQHRWPLLSTVIWADYDPTTPMPSGTRLLEFVETTNYNFTGLPATPTSIFPMGTPVRTHRVDWTSIYGIRPTYTSELVVGTCVVVPSQSTTSGTTTQGFDVGNWVGNSVITLGNPAPTGLTGCSLDSAQLELVDGTGTVLDIGDTVSNSIQHWFLFVPVNFNISATVLSRPRGPNMSGAVATTWDLGRTNRVRWRYEFTGAATCNPR